MGRIKQWLKSKTINFGLLLGILGAVQANQDVFSYYLSPKGFGWVGMGIALAIVVLRFMTTTAVKEK